MWRAMAARSGVLGDAEETLLLVVLVILALLVAAIVLRVAVVLAAPLLIGGAIAYLIGSLAGWLEGRVEKHGEAYRLVIDVHKPVEVLVVWLVAALLVVALLR